MEYTGKSRYVRARIKVTSKHWGSRYGGQECDAIIYDAGINPQINSEQLNPPLPKWQSAFLDDLEILDGD